MFLNQSVTLMTSPVPEMDAFIDGLPLYKMSPLPEILASRVSAQLVSIEPVPKISRSASLTKNPNPSISPDPSLKHDKLLAVPESLISASPEFEFWFLWVRYL